MHIYIDLILSMLLLLTYQIVFPMNKGGAVINVAIEKLTLKQHRKKKKKFKVFCISCI